MILYFKSTKNRLELDTAAKTIKTGYAVRYYVTFVKVRQYELRHIIEEAKNNGYKEV